MLRDREPVTLRSLVAGTGGSTMAVYTHFGGMDGLWRALRQEGFTRLATRLSTVTLTTDSVRDLTALVAAYLQHALDYPDLYRVMFDATVDLEDLPAADETLEQFVQAARRSVQSGRFRQDVVPLELATQSWILGHGLASLVSTGPLPPPTLSYGVPMLTALYVGAGDDAERCQASVQRSWPVFALSNTCTGQAEPSPAAAPIDLPIPVPSSARELGSTKIVNGRVS